MTSGAEHNPAIPFIGHALAVLRTEGGGTVPVRPERLKRLAFRVLLYAQAAPFVPLLLAADLQADPPGTLTVDPGSLDPPDGLPPEVRAEWPNLVGQVAALFERFSAECDEVMAALPRAGGLVDATGVPTPDPDDDDGAALVDEAVAEAMAARRSGEASALEAELDLWVHAAALAIRRRPNTEGTVLPKLLLEQLQSRRAYLMSAWSPLLTPAQRVRLEAGEE